MDNIIYKVYYHGVEILDEAATLEGAKRFADNWWAELHAGCRDNRVRGDCVVITAYDVDEDRIVESIRHGIIDDGYHGDYAEHNTQWGL